MTEFPEPPPPPKGTPWKIIIPVAIVLVLCCLCLVVVGVFAYLGSQGTGPLSMLATATPTPLPTRTHTPTQALSIVGTWNLYYSWECTGTFDGPVDLEFFADYTFFVTQEDSLSPGTWILVPPGIDFIFDGSPYAHYIGTLDAGYTYMDGTMDTTDDSSGCWYATPK